MTFATEHPDYERFARRVAEVGALQAYTEEIERAKREAAQRTHDVQVEHACEASQLRSVLRGVLSRIERTWPEYLAACPEIRAWWDSARALAAKAPPAAATPDRWATLVTEGEASGCYPCDTCGGFRAKGRPCQVCTATIARARPPPRCEGDPVSEQSRHSPEPWRIAVDYAQVDVVDANGAMVCMTGDEVPEHGHDERAERGRRIVACVNACAGLSTEGLEAGHLGGLLQAAAWFASPTPDGTTEDDEEASRDAGAALRALGRLP